jgi:hypothetical protein
MGLEQETTMSGMGSVSAAGAQYSAASTNAAAAHQRMDPAQMAERMQEDLSEKLTSAGVSEDVRAAIQTDVRAAMEAEMSSGSRRDPEATKETINGIFAEYGLNAEEFMAKGPPPGGGGRGGPGGPGGPGGAQGANNSKADALQELLETLQEESDDEDDEEGSVTDTSTLLDQISEQIVDLLFGIDEEV